MKRRDLLNRIFGSYEERQYAISKALDLQSHVTEGLWLLSL